MVMEGVLGHLPDTELDTDTDVEGDTETEMDAEMEMDTETAKDGMVMTQKK